MNKRAAEAALFVFVDEQKSKHRRTTTGSCVSNQTAFIDVRVTQHILILWVSSLNFHPLAMQAP